MDWNEYFIKMARLVAEKSKDRSTKVGVVVVGPSNEIRSTGYNGFCRGINDNVESRHERPIKYKFTEHAERNSIYNAARMGLSMEGCTMYFNYEPIPCTDCTRAVIQSGIKKLVGYDIKFPARGEFWEADMKVSEEMLTESGIEIIRLPTEQGFEITVKEIGDKLHALYTKGVS